MLLLAGVAAADTDVTGAFLMLVRLPLLLLVSLLLLRPLAAADTAC